MADALVGPAFSSRMSYEGRMAEGFDKVEVVVGKVEVRPARSPTF